MAYIRSWYVLWRKSQEEGQEYWVCGCSFDTKAGKMTLEQWLTAPEEGEHFGLFIYLTPRTRLGGSE